MAQQLLNGWERHGQTIQSIRRWIEERLGKRMTKIMWTQKRRKLCCLPEFGNDLPNAAFSQRATLTEKEMPIWPGAPGSNRFSPFCRPLAPAFCQVFTVVEIRIERFAYFLDEWNLTMFESLATSNDEQPTPCGDLHVGNLKGRHLRDSWTCIPEQGSQSQRQSMIAANELFGTSPNGIPLGLG